jgi:Tfp pilus assembly protein PilF
LHKEISEKKAVKRKLRPSYILNTVLIIAVLVLAYPKIFKGDLVKRLSSSGEKISVAVMPFQNMTNDTTWNVWKDGIQQSLISSLSNTEELFVRQKESVNSLLQTNEMAENASISANRYIEKFVSIQKGISSTEGSIKADLADIYTEAGNVDKAEELYREALLSEPDNPGLLNNFAVFLRDNNRSLDEFTGIIDRAIKLAPNKYDYYSYLDTKGWGLYKQGKYQESLEILQRTWDEAPYKLYDIKSHLEEVKKAIAGQK